MWGLNIGLNAVEAKVAYGRTCLKSKREIGVCLSIWDLEGMESTTYQENHSLLDSCDAPLRQLLQQTTSSNFHTFQNGRGTDTVPSTTPR